MGTTGVDRNTDWSNDQSHLDVSSILTVSTIMDRVAQNGGNPKVYYTGRAPYLDIVNQRCVSYCYTVYAESSTRGHILQLQYNIFLE